MKICFSCKESKPNLRRFTNMTLCEECAIKRGKRWDIGERVYSRAQILREKAAELDRFDDPPVAASDRIKGIAERERKNKEGF